MMAAELRLTPIIRADLGENDRSATGYLPRAEFEAMADAFFSRPDKAWPAGSGRSMPSAASSGLWMTRCCWLGRVAMSPSSRTAGSAHCCCVI